MSVKNPNSIPNPKLHYVISMVKSCIRIFGSIAVTILAYSTGQNLIAGLAATIFLAELVGVFEEMV